MTRDLATDVTTLEIANDQGSSRIAETGTVVPGTSCSGRRCCGVGADA
ncbi:hypothetical protein [Georgenia sp. H159]|nr:hypothetical protein [Georgenia sp. H159]